MQLWPVLAEWFGVEIAPPLRMPLRKFMPEHEETWNQIRQKYSLKELPWDKVSLLGLNADSIANMQRYRVYLGFLLWENLMASVAYAACSGRIWRDERQLSKRWGTSQTCWMACKFCCHSCAVSNKILHATDESVVSSPAHHVQHH